MIVENEDVFSDLAQLMEFSEKVSKSVVSIDKRIASGNIHKGRLVYAKRNLPNFVCLCNEISEGNDFAILVAGHIAGLILFKDEVDKNDLKYIFSNELNAAADYFGFDAEQTREFIHSGFGALKCARPKFDFSLEIPHRLESLARKIAGEDGYWVLRSVWLQPGLTRLQLLESASECDESLYAGVVTAIHKLVDSRIICFSSDIECIYIHPSIASRGQGSDFDEAIYVNDVLVVAAKMLLDAVRLFEKRHANSICPVIRANGKKRSNDDLPKLFGKVAVKEVASAMGVSESLAKQWSIKAVIVDNKYQKKLAEFLEFKNAEIKRNYLAFFELFDNMPDETVLSKLDVSRMTISRWRKRVVPPNTKKLSAYIRLLSR